MFHRARKGLGAIKETEESAWVVKATKEGDTLAALARGYGVTPAEIAKQNGIPFSTGAIQEWVKATGGKVSEDHVRNYLTRSSSMGSHKLQYVLDVLGLGVVRTTPEQG
jgi:hypothetical protein